MNKFTQFILNHKLLIIIFFIVALILSVVGFMFVETNSDVQSYLPDDMISSVGKEELASKFGIKGEFNIAVKGADKEYMDNFTADLAKNELIKQIAWIGRFDALKLEIEDASSFEKPFLEQSYKKVLDKFLKSSEDGENVYIVGIYLNIDNTEDAAMDLIDDIENTVKQAIKEGQVTEYFMGGGAYNAKQLLESSIGEIPKYLVVAVIIIFIILLITTKSWLEPFIFLLTLGISIIINMGSNIIIGKISTITYSASTILQLALAMDYSIFLMHSYYEERKFDPLADAKTAMSRALPKTLKSVSASALTTVGGFIALFTMKFGMGYDLGAVLAKGVFLSLVTVIFLQPILILMLDKAIGKTKHKYFTPKIKKTQKLACKIRKPLAIIALVLIIPTFVGQLFVPLNYLTMNKETKNPSVTQQIVEASNNQIIMIIPDKSDVDPKDYVKHYDFIDKVKKLDNVGNIFTAYSIVPRLVYDLGRELDPALQAQLEATFFKDGYVLYTFEMKSPVESEATYKTIDTLLSYANNMFNTDGTEQIGITGLSAGAKDLAKITPSDFIKVSLISALIIFIILMFTYKSFSLSLILLFVIELGIWINLSIVTLIGSKINFMSYLIISSIQLGATVDYAILVVSKYKQVLKDGERNHRKAIYKGVELASPSILVSASVLIAACISVFAVTSNVIISEITMLIGAGALMSTILVMTLLPAILMIKANFHKSRTEKKLIAAGIPIEKTEEEIPDDKPKKKEKRNKIK